MADFTTKCPSVFQSLGADPEIQFCFASKDPSGNPSNGHHQNVNFSTGFATDNKVKYTAQGAMMLGLKKICKHVDL